MKRAFCVIVLVVAVANCPCQSSKLSAAPDLSKFSSDQLKACYNDKSICGADGEYEISDELTHRLPAFATEQLVKCFAEWKICGVGNISMTGWAVSEEVARRGDPHELLVRYWSEPDNSIRYGIVHVAYQFDTPEVTEFMKNVLAARRGDDDELYWPASYSAEKCDPAALKWLSTRKGRPEGCIIFAGTVKVFGKCKYRPAISYLVTYSLDDVCLNIVGDAEESLETLYPDHPARFDTLGAEQNYYCRRALKEGFKVRCSAK
ncbi:MAG: hypothetical protein ABSF23_13345 [Terracidiphilus sp.]|jgi:hypothetical protein